MNSENTSKLRGLVITQLAQAGRIGLGALLGQIERNSFLEGFTGWVGNPPRVHFVEPLMVEELALTKNKDGQLQTVGHPDAGINLSSGAKRVQKLVQVTFDPRLVTDVPIFVRCTPEQLSIATPVEVEITLKSVSDIPNVVAEREQLRRSALKHGFDLERSRAKFDREVAEVRIGVGMTFVGEIALQEHVLSAAVVLQEALPMGRYRGLLFADGTLPPSLNGRMLTGCCDGTKEGEAISILRFVS